jgi:dephospho-CoA kinase
VPYIVGLTGGIGSGKTTVERLFKTFSVDIIDTDAIAHLLTAPNGLGIPSIQSQFGIEFLNSDGSLNRSAMRQLIFRDPDAKHKLEQILHPSIRVEVDAQLHRTRTPYVILAVPLLVETGAYQDRLDRVLVIDCTEEQQVRRTSARSKLSEQEVRDIMATQVGRKERIRHADDIILNNGELAQLTPATTVLDQRFRVLAALRETT